MLCAAIDIGSNTTRVLVAEPEGGHLRGVMDQKAFTRLGQASGEDGAIGPEKMAEVADAVATQVRLAEELDADAIRIVATAAIRDAANRDEVAGEIARACGLPVEILSEQEEGRLAFMGATRTLGHVVAGEVAVVDVGGGSTEIVLGTLSGGVRSVSSFKIGSGSLTDNFRTGDPPSAAEIRALREHVDAAFDGRRRWIARSRPWRWAAVRPRCARSSGRCSSTRPSNARSRVLTGDSIADVAKRFELDPRRVRCCRRACSCWRSSPACSAARCRSARARCATA